MAGRFFFTRDSPFAFSVSHLERASALRQLIDASACVTQYFAIVPRENCPPPGIRPVLSAQSSRAQIFTFFIPPDCYPRTRRHSLAPLYSSLEREKNFPFSRLCSSREEKRGKIYSLPFSPSYLKILFVPLRMRSFQRE